MDNPLFPIRPARSDMPLGVLVLNPYREEGTWMFDDAAAGLHREPFVGAINGMLDRLSHLMQQTPALTLLETGATK